MLAGDVINAITRGGPDAAGHGHPHRPAHRRRSPSSTRCSRSVQRFFSSRIGEGIIFDLRTQVYDHVQRMPLQFFTRTQTGALVSRLNSDVLGAQQAFTSTLSGTVGNIIALVLTAGVMFSLSWQVTALSLVLVPAFLLPARWVGRRLAEITRESYQLDAKMNATMTERFGVAGALLVKLFGRPEVEAERFSGRAARVRDIGVQQAMYGTTFFVAMMLVASLAQALTYGLGGWLAVSGTIERRHGRHARAAADPALRADHRAVQRPGQHHERAGVVRAGLRGARPAAGDRGEAGRGGGAEGRGAGSSSATCGSATRPPPRCPSPRWRTWRPWTVRSPSPCCAASRSPSSRVRWSPWSARRARASRRPRCWCRASTTSPRARCSSAASTCATRRLASLRDTIGVVTQDAHLFHETIAENLRYARPDATDDELWTALERAQIGDLVRTLPDGLDTVVGERGYRFSGGEKQRIAIARLLLKAPSIVILDEATAHLDSRVRGGRAAGADRGAAAAGRRL